MLQFGKNNQAELKFYFIGSSEGIRRQDVADLAMGALSKGLTPISIFSNLLNAYATLDNKHDITGDLLNRLKFEWVDIVYTDSSCLYKNLFLNKLFKVVWAQRLFMQQRLTL